MEQLRKLGERFRLIDGDVPTQMRSYPADPTCKHKVSCGKCFCIDKCAEYIEQCVEEWCEDCEECESPEGWQSTDQHAPFHKKVVDVAKTSTYSITASPLMKHVPLSRRAPGIWHCCHNCRTSMWILLKDMASKWNMIGQLKAAMSSKEIGLSTIKVAAKDRKNKKGGFAGGSVEQIIINEAAEGLRVAAVAAEDQNDGNDRTSMDGTELLKVMANTGLILTKMEEGGIPREHKWRWERFKDSMTRALTSFNAGVAFALADIWEEDHSHEMGEHFRQWADIITDEMGPAIGLPYEGRSYLDILPAHWLTEPDHLEQHATKNWVEFGVAPGVNTDATCEMVSSHTTVLVSSCSVCGDHARHWLAVSLFFPAGGAIHEEDAKLWAGQQCWRHNFEHRKAEWQQILEVSCLEIRFAIVRR